MRQAGSGGAYVINGKALSQRCTTLEDAVAYLATGGGGAGTKHPDIRVRPTGEPVQPKQEGNLRRKPSMCVAN